MERPSLLQVLQHARALIASPDCWIASGYGANAERQWRPIGSPDAVRFTVLGAVIRAAGGSKELLAAARLLFAQVAPEPSARLISTTDPPTHDESLRLLDLAIAHLDASRTAWVPKQSGVVSRGALDPLDTSLAGLGEALDRPGRR